MSIAQAQKVKELEREVAELHRADSFQEEEVDRLNNLLMVLSDRLTALENRPKPGRPPKNG